MLEMQRRGRGGLYPSGRAHRPEGKKGNWGQGDQGQMMLQEQRRHQPSWLGWECYEGLLEEAASGKSKQLGFMGQSGEERKGSDPCGGNSPARRRESVQGRNVFLSADLSHGV